MLKRFGVLALTLASFGALIPATASAAERGREQTNILVEHKDDHGRARVEERRITNDRRVIVRRAPVAYYAPARTCR